MNKITTRINIKNIQDMYDIQYITAMIKNKNDILTANQQRLCEVI